jgi:hypothetical protein
LPEVRQRDLFHEDGTACDPEEIRLMKRLADKRKEWLGEAQGRLCHATD